MQEPDDKTIREEKGIVGELCALPDDARITFSDHGWTSRVYLVNRGEFVFKFPRFEKTKEEYALEVLAYMVARDVGGVLIPEVRWEHPNRNYLGYRGIIGRPVDTVIPTLTASEKRSIGSRLGTFLKKFHERTIAGAPLISPDRELSDYRHKLELGLPQMEEHFSEPEIDQIRRFVTEEYPQKMSELGFRRGLCHGDLGYWNMIYSPQGEIGLVDFGDVAYCDTSKDFAGMDDPDMLDAALEAYAGDVSREKIGLRMKVHPILDLPFFVGKNDQDGIARTVAGIRRILSP
jgi:aminoglycoside phosphotransferase (APT) family kinase protein